MEPQLDVAYCNEMAPLSSFFTNRLGSMSKPLGYYQIFNGNSINMHVLYSTAVIDDVVALYLTPLHVGMHIRPGSNPKCHASVIYLRFGKLVSK